MNLTNYRDVGKGGTDTEAGFQFEFYCGNCSRTWTSPFKPYRKGQIAGFIQKFAYLLGDRGSMSRASGAVAGVGAKKARESALQDALELAEQRYCECAECSKTVCGDCWDERARTCVPCTGKSSRGRGSEAAQDGKAGLKCANCGVAMESGRFCAECGFDVASTHKSCPGCGTLCARAARFCTDCGHGF